ncbi:MAG: hypothetical protein E6G97_15670 [Alphaproteobacteria bacterium]|nr:MAG: hypothetical protein E6G97_15670 [Alphaproteobacteria bacterium]
MAFIQPNLFVLSGGSIHVTYTTTGFDGKPHFTYTSWFVTHTFSGTQIKTEPSVLGTLVSVTILQTVDAGSTTFTVLIPRINLNQGEALAITTEGITTHHRFSIFPPAMHGQLDTYSVVTLTGTAQHVVF